MKTPIYSSTCLPPFDFTLTGKPHLIINVIQPIKKWWYDSSASAPERKQEESNKACHEFLSKKLSISHSFNNKICYISCTSLTR